jgi:hypothetical protein
MEIKQAAQVSNDEVAALKARIADLERQATQRAAMKLSFAVSKQGGVSVYGLQRFPVMFYKEQWTRLGEAMPAVLDFVKAHDSELKVKATVATVAKVASV